GYRLLAIGYRLFTIQFHANAFRIAQYVSGGSAKAERLCRDASLSSRAVARKFDCNCVTVVAPLSTTSANGCARHTASATTSTVVWSSVASRLRAASFGRNSGLVLRSVKRPLATASLIKPPRPARDAASSAGPADCSNKFQVA